MSVCSVSVTCSVKESRLFAITLVLTISVYTASVKSVSCDRNRRPLTCEATSSGTSLTGTFVGRNSCEAGVHGARGAAVRRPSQNRAGKKHQGRQRLGVSADGQEGAELPVSSLPTNPRSQRRERRLLQRCVTFFEPPPFLALLWMVCFSPPGFIQLTGNLPIKGPHA